MPEKTNQTREDYDRASTEYQAVASQLASIYQIGSTTPEIELLTNQKTVLEEKLATLANSLQTTTQTAISWYELFAISED